VNFLPSKIQIPNLSKWRSYDEVACKRCISRGNGSFYHDGDCKHHKNLGYRCSYNYDTLIAKTIDHCSTYVIIKIFYHRIQVNIQIILIVIITKIIEYV